MGKKRDYTSFRTGLAPWLNRSQHNNSNWKMFQTTSTFLSLMPLILLVLEILYTYNFIFFINILVTNCISYTFTNHCSFYDTWMFCKNVNWGNWMWGFFDFLFIWVLRFAMTLVIRRVLWTLTVVNSAFMKFFIIATNWLEQSFCG